VRRNLIQIVHSFGFYPNVFTVPVARLAGASIVVPRFATRGLVDSHAETAAETGLPAGRLRPGEREAIRENLLEQGYKPGNIVVIRNGITLAKAHEKSRRPTPAGAGNPASARVVAVFSRLNRMKGVEYFLDAAQFWPEVSGCAFPGGRRWRKQPELEEHARRLGLERRIVFTDSAAMFPICYRKPPSRCCRL